MFINYIPPQFEFSILQDAVTVKPVLSDHSKIGKNDVNDKW